MSFEIKNRFKAILPMPPRINAKFAGVNGSGRLFVTPEYREYKNSVLSLATGKLSKPYDSSVAITVVFYRKYKKGDIDSCLKSLLDSLQGIMYIKDSQIIEMHVFNKEDGQNPRCEVFCESI